MKTQETEMQTPGIKKFIGLALVGLTLNQASFDVKAEVTVRGMGSCGKWVQTKGTSARLSPEAWVVGFISGIALGTNVDLLKSNDNESLFLWLDNFCRDNPLLPLYDASNKLSLELEKKNTKR